MFEVTFNENYAVLHMKSGQNRFNVEFLKQFHSALDEIERNKDVQFMIATGDGKFFSNGLDLDFLAKCSPEEALKTVNGFPSLLLRLLTFPVPTIAALNGHAFAGGALLALVHDYQIMRTKRGYFSVNEIHLGLNLSDSLILLLRAKIKDPKTLTDTVLMGKRFTAEEALSGGIVQKICPVEQLLGTAAEMGQAAVGNQQTINRYTLNVFKTDLYREIVDALKRQVVNTEKSFHTLSQMLRKNSKL